MAEGHVSYILVHLVERHEVGYEFARTRSDWPLHITLVPWFYVTRTAELVRAVETVVQEMPAFSVTVGEDVTFGKRQEIPVNVIQNQAELLQLHTQLLEAVEIYGDGLHVDPPPYARENYTAHVTHHVKDGVVHRSYPGDKLMINDVTLLQLRIAGDKQFCQVMQHVELAES